MTGSTSEQRRLAIVRAAMPLLGEYDTLTTAHIAQAAGLGETDLLAVFANKEAVMQACFDAMTEAVSATIDPAGEVQELDAIRTDQPLALRLVEVLEILDAYYRRIRTDLDLLQHVSLPDPVTADAPDVRPSGGQGDLRFLGRSPELRRAITKLLEPDEQRLRLPAHVLAEAFVGMAFDGVWPAGPDQSPLQAAQVVDLFLHGALNTD